MKAKTLYMETTCIDAHKTAGEITTLLVSSGARQISMEYDADGKLTGLAFLLVIQGHQHPFRLPVRTEPVFKILNGRRRSSYDQARMRTIDREQAERVAWRQLLRWVQAQFGLIEVGMAAAAEVFLPYMQEPSGRTVYEIFTETRFKALPPAENAGA